MRLKLNINSGFVDLVNNYGKEISFKCAAFISVYFLSLSWRKLGRPQNWYVPSVVYACAIITFKLYLIALKYILQQINIIIKPHYYFFFFVRALSNERARRCPGENGNDRRISLCRLLGMLAL